MNYKRGLTCKKSTESTVGFMYFSDAHLKQTKTKYQQILTDNPNGPTGPALPSGPYDKNKTYRPITDLRFRQAK